MALTLPLGGKNFFLLDIGPIPDVQFVIFEMATVVLSCWVVRVENLRPYLLHYTFAFCEVSQYHQQQGVALATSQRK
jgi:hypothetical protein